MTIHIYIDKEKIESLRECIRERNIQKIPKYYTFPNSNLDGINPSNEIEVDLEYNDFVWLEDNKN